MARTCALLTKNRVLGIGRKIVLLVFFVETLRMRSAVSASPLVLARLLLAITLLLKRAHYDSRNSVK